MANSAGKFIVRFDPEDMRRVDTMLRTLPGELRNKVLGQAIVDAAQPVLHAARSKVPVRTGRLAASLKVGRIDEPGAVGARVYASRTGGDIGGYYAHLVEFGHRLVILSKTGLYEKGTIPGQPFLGPALVENVSKVVSEIAASVRRRIEKVKV